ncbi:MAG: hypothetical protein ACON42_08345 [Flavobacteriaceae bacterium]
MEDGSTLLELSWTALHEASAKEFSVRCQQYAQSPQDVILNASGEEAITETSQLNKWRDLVAEHQKTLVLIFPADRSTSLDEHQWNVVPTALEASDFIAFEQMQRDLGF